MTAAGSRTRVAVLLAALGSLASAPASVGAAAVPGLPRFVPESVGMSSARLERIGEVFDEHVRNRDLAGVVTLVARGGGIVHLEAHGELDRASGTPMPTDAIFRLASMTKMVTVVAALMLYEEGRFQLTDAISTYLPELGDMRVASPDPDHEGEWGLVRAQRKITIQDLFRHTSGITYSSPAYVGDMYTERSLRSGTLTSAEFVRRLSLLPLADQPGTRWRYGFSLDVIGRLIEVLSGQPLDVFCRERIFEPLGMDDTGFWVPAAKLDRLASVYDARDGDLLLLEDSSDTSFSEPPLAPSGGGGWGNRYEGGLVTTAEDFARLLQMLLDGGTYAGRRLLGPKIIELLHTDQLGDVAGPWPGVGFGLGVAVLTDLGQYGALGSEGMFWWGGAASTYFWVDPAEDLCAVFMLQLFPRAYLNMDEQFQSLVYQAITESPPQESP